MKTVWCCRGIGIVKEKSLFEKIKDKVKGIEAKG